MNENEGFGFVRPEIVSLLNEHLAKWDAEEEEKLRQQELDDSYESGFADGEYDYEQSCWASEACFDDDHQEFIEEHQELYDDWLRKRSNGTSSSSDFDFGDLGARAKTLE